MAKVLPNLREVRNLKIQEFQGTPSRLISKRPIIIKLLEVKDEERILKIAIEKGLFVHKDF